MGAKLKAIRAAIRDRLLDRTDAQLRVSTNRADSVWDDGLPAIVIHTQSETVVRSDEAPPVYRRTARIQIDLLIADAAGAFLDDAADDFAEQVEQLLFADPNLGEIVHDGMQVGFDLIVEDGAEHLFAGVRITWEYMYFQEAPNGDLGRLTPWKVAHTEYSLDPSAPAP